MKSFLTLFTALLACLCLVPHAAAAWRKPNKNDRVDCLKKNRDVGLAIGIMCTKYPNLVVPSGEAKEGVWSPNGKSSIWIRGDCKPKQWVPREYCYKQFFNMCVNMDKSGKASRSYGRKNCQDWHVKNF